MKKNAYLTVYLCLFLALILSLYLILIEEVRVNGAGVEAVCAAEAGMTSILAEYHRGLAEGYDLFCIDTSYGTDTPGRNQTEAHLLRYVKQNLGTEGLFLSDWLYRDLFGLRAYDAELQKVRFLTDDGGEVFRSLAVDAVKDDLNLNLFQKVKDWAHIIEINGLEEVDLEAQKQELIGNLGISQSTWKEIIEKKKDAGTSQILSPQLMEEPKAGLLSLVLEEENLSSKALNEQGLVAERMKAGEINAGNMDPVTSESVVQSFLFREYILRYLGNYREPKENGALAYQAEYVIAGKSSDIANVKSITARILLIRGAANSLFLRRDEGKQNEIKAAAALASFLIGEPKAEKGFEELIINTWATAESVYDLKEILKGGKIPLLKDKDSWHYDLDAVFGKEEEEENEEQEGMTYQDYLRVLLFLTGTEKLTLRTMNMAEADMRMSDGNVSFRLDACICSLEAAVRMSDGKGNEYEVVRTKEY
ncbi:MAG: DUF5702 domain-containing protein [Acetatifactor sp.]|nr:DUF5702 domain-containing protein [Acetatifactor sp.]